MNNKYYKLYLTNKSKYIRNIQGYKGKSNLIIEIEEDNEYDSKAVLVSTYNRNKEKIEIGYLQKYNYSPIYTEEAEELYYKIQYEDLSWDEAKSSKDWGVIEKWNKELIFEDIEELNALIKDLLENQKDYGFVYDYESNSGFIFHKDINKVENE